MDFFRNLDQAGRKKLLIISIIVFILFVATIVLIILFSGRGSNGDGNEANEYAIQGDRTPSTALVFQNNARFILNSMDVSGVNQTHIQNCIAAFVLSPPEINLAPNPKPTVDDYTTTYVANLQSFNEILPEYFPVYSYQIPLYIDDGRMYALYYASDVETLGENYIFVAIYSPASGRSFLCARPSEDTYIRNAQLWIMEIPNIDFNKLQVDI